LKVGKVAEALEVGKKTNATLTWIDQ